MARGRADGGRDSAGIGASGFFGTRAASAKERAAGAALASISEDASRVMQRRIWHEGALGFARANADVCSRVKKLDTSERHRSASELGRCFDARESTNWLG